MFDANMMLFSCNANKELAKEIAKYLKKPLSPVEISNFADEEIFLRILENVRGTACPRGLCSAKNTSCRSWNGSRCEYVLARKGIM